MPLILDGSGPVAGTLAASLTLAQKAAAIPALMGVYDARDLSPGAVTQWVPRYGAVPLAQTNVGNEPVRGTMDGQDAVLWAATAALFTPAASWATTDPGTVAMRVYLSEPGTDQQYLYGFGAPHNCAFRSAIPGVRVRTNAANLDRAMTPVAPGWYDLISTHDGTTATLDVFGASASIPAPTGVAGTQLIIGNSIAKPVGNGLRGAISRIVIAKSAMIGTAEYGHVRDLLAS